jgi:4-hydroxybenzoyl-CoA thioesterase
VASLTFRRQLTVEWGDCDPAGIVFNPRFFEYFDANSLKPIKFGDKIEIASRISEFRRSSFDVEHRISVGGELAVDGGETRVWAVRSTDDPERIAATAIPEVLIAKFNVS